MVTLRTTLCDLLRIEVPIIQAPISGAATPALVAAVSNELLGDPRFALD